PAVADLDPAIDFLIGINFFLVNIYIWANSESKTQTAHFPLFPSIFTKSPLSNQISPLDMEAANGGSYGTSWADQWDSGPDPVSQPAPKDNGGGAGGKYKQKVGEGLGKTKSAAVIGMKKVKQGTSVGFQWLKDKGTPYWILFIEQL
ncbi:hypothetical protein LINGRAHAP2_LOCUS20993, partial [Linum grandiflorum]